MNLKKVKISDVAKELQTDEFKMKIYRQIEKFVYKNQKHFYPHYQGDVQDLVTDLFMKFCAPKKHRNGEVFSELDRVDPGKVGGGEWTGDDDKAIATYVQRFVTARLIDLERMDKQEVRASENYDEKHGGLTLDRAARGGKKGNSDDGSVDGAYVENINYQFYDLMDNPQAIKNARRSLLNNPAQVKRIKSLAKHYADKLDPQVVEFINKLIGEDEEPEVVEPSKAQKEISNLLGESVKITSYTLQDKPAVKMAFPDRDAMNAAKEKQAQVISHMEEDGYSFYKAHGSNWYFFKKSEVGDSIIADGRKMGGIDPRTGKRMSHEESLNYDGPERKFVSFEAYKKDNPVEGVDFTWVDQDGKDLPNFHQVTDVHGIQVEAVPAEVIEKLPKEVKPDGGYIMWPESYGEKLREFIEGLPEDEQFDIDDVYLDEDGWYHGNPVHYKCSDAISEWNEIPSAMGITELDQWLPAGIRQSLIEQLYKDYDLHDEHTTSSIQEFIDEHEVDENQVWADLEQYLSSDKKNEFVQDFMKLYERDDSMKISDATSTERFNALATRVGDKPQHYLNQINKCGPSKKTERMQTFYKLARQQGFDQTAEAIKNAFPEEYSPEEINNAKEEERKKAQAKKQQEREAARQKTEDAKKAALEGGPTYCNVSKAPGRMMSSPDNIFVRFANKHPEGFVVEVSNGDTSVGAPYERRDGRVWTIANKYTVSNGERTETFDIANLTNEGYDPSVKSGWDTDGHGKKWFVGASFGWLLNGQKMKFSEIKSTIEQVLGTFK